MGKPTSTKIPIPSHNPQWDRWSYRIGCPVWKSNRWSDEVYPDGTSDHDLLTWYSYAFPTVEGNTTFYGVPASTTFEKWRDSVAEGFRFCMKFPRHISHDLKLMGCDAELQEWLSRLEILQKGDCLGPTFLQLAPFFSFAYFAQLEAFLRKLPRDWPWAVEVRHDDWYDDGEQEQRLNDLLMELGMDRVLLDSSPLNSLRASDWSEMITQSRKPKNPFRTTTTGKRPMLRLIGRNNATEVAEYWERWSEQIAHWIREGYEPWVFTHSPDDAFAPGLAKLLHDMVRIHLSELPLLKDWREVHREDQHQKDGFTQLPLF